MTRRFGALAALVLAAAASSAIAQSDQAEFSRVAFDLADRDGNEVVDEAELMADAITGFVALDADGDGAVEAGEADLGAADPDGDGRLTFEELMARKIAQMRAADVNGDGVLSFEETLAFDRAN
jgi:Ca2+-binding EF-hand superfamily protein